MLITFTVSVQSDIMIIFTFCYQNIVIGLFSVLFLLLRMDYGKQPDDNILIVESKYYHYINLYREYQNYDHMIFKLLFILIFLRLFNIHLISIKQIIIFIIGLLLVPFLIALDPFGAFSWYFN